MFFNYGIILKDQNLPTHRIPLNKLDTPVKRFRARLELKSICFNNLYL